MKKRKNKKDIEILRYLLLRIALTPFSLLFVAHKILTIYELLRD